MAASRPFASNAIDSYHSKTPGAVATLSKASVGRDRSQVTGKSDVTARHSRHEIRAPESGSDDYRLSIGHETFGGILPCQIT